MALKFRTKIDLLILTIVLIVGSVAVIHARTIGDWWHLSRYDPSPEISRISQDAGMSAEGRKLFYRFSPRVVEPDEMEEQCDHVRLGCIQGNSILILKPSGPAEYDRAVVTAAHEMLHVVYERLDEAEKDRLHQLLDQELDRPSQRRLRNVVRTYPDNDYYNEAHSFVGSEADDISTELENHYAQYFDDRSKVLKAFANSPEGP